MPALVASIHAFLCCHGGASGRDKSGHDATKKQIDISTMIDVTRVRKLGAYKLEIEFSDGTVGVRDFVAIKR
jgi:hypothetical protein